MSLEFFFRRLTQPERDQFVAIVSEANADDSLARAEVLEKEIERLRRQLDEKHSARESLKERLVSIESLLASADKEAHDDLDAVGLKLWLTSLRAELRGRIADLHPEEDLRKKQDLTHQRDALLARREFTRVVAVRLLLPARTVDRPKSPTTVKV